MAERGSLLEGLGLVGLGAIEPVVIAAAAAEMPILLVGPHGTGKSLLLTRVAEALGLRWRHYNASLLSYDDLAGYPVPDGKGSLDWLRTPATIWGAEAVFLDEINRCRPDLQNKLFPIVHERMIQGIPLPELRHRWAAMNPVSDDDDAPADLYRGAEPLDMALADRFPFVVEMPDWRKLPVEMKERLLAADLVPVDPAAQAAFAGAVAETRERYRALVTVPDPVTVSYIRHLLHALDEAHLPLSARRGATLVRTIGAIRATGLTDPDDAALLALRAGLPQRATTVPISETVLMAAHKDALSVCRLGKDDPIFEVRALTDPFERTLRALTLTQLDPVFRTGVVADGFATIPAGARFALSYHAMENGLADGLHGAVAGQIAEAYARLVTPQGVNQKVAAHDGRYNAWQMVMRVVGGRRPSVATTLIENLLVSGWKDGSLANENDVRDLNVAWRHARTRLRALAPAKPAAGHRSASEAPVTAEAA